MSYRYLLFIIVVLFASACNHHEPSSLPAEEEWVQLFNKRNLEGWDIKITKHDLNDNFNNTFKVKDSLLVVDYSGYTHFDGEFGHLYYNKPFSHYKIRVSYRFTGSQLAGGPDYAYLNSGVMLHCQGAETVSHDQSFPVSLEMQFLAADSSRQRTTGNLCTPGTIVSINGKPDGAHCINSTSPGYEPGKWIEAEAVVLGDSIIHHIIEGDTVLTYTKPQIGGGFISPGQPWARFGFGADSLTWIGKNGQPLSSGYIALQAESHPLEFRKVELLNLAGCMDKTATNYRSYYVKADNASCRY